MGLLAPFQWLRSFSFGCSRTCHSLLTSGAKRYSKLNRCRTGPKQYKGSICILPWSYCIYLQRCKKRKNCIQLVTLSPCCGCFRALGLIARFNANRVLKCTRVPPSAIGFVSCSHVGCNSSDPPSTQNLHLSNLEAGETAHNT